MRMLSAIFVCCLLLSQELAASEVVAEDFEATQWHVDQYSRARGKAALSMEAAPEASASKKSLHLTVPFNGKEFQWCTVKPVAPLYIPGVLKRVRFWAKISDASYGIELGFQNGWYQGKQDKKGLKHSFQFKAANTWQLCEMDIPGDWRQPLALASFNVHNWSKEKQAKEVQIWIDDISIETDLSNVDKQGRLKSWAANPNERSGEKKKHPHTPLFELTAKPHELCAVYVEQDAAFDLSVRSWLGKAINGSLAYVVRDHQEQEVTKGSSKVSIQSVYKQELKIPKQGFGLYYLDLALFYDGNVEKQRIRFVQLPKAVDLSEEQRDRSPYGLNVHGGRAVLITPFTKAGIPWFRDYVFNKNHSKICRGKDGEYNGWPYFKPLVEQYKKHNVRVLGCRGGRMQHITKEQAESGVFPPLKQEWIDEYTDLVKRFPYIHHWEIDNEYDLHKENYEIEKTIGWKNYGVNHRDFGKMMKDVTGGKKFAVENGRAGIWPDRLEEQIDGGYFKDIQVANVHHYSGIEPAEINYGNFNTGFDGRKGRLFFDNLRATKKVAQKDGVKREVWLTEFGWDTKAGHVVSHYEQAAFLPRGFMCFIMADIDKSFWFFDIDSNTADNFFDGCGLLMHHPNFEPKLALSAMAGLTQRLPDPKALGQVNIGDGTWGYAFEQSGKVVVALFSVTDDKGPSYTFEAEALHDFLGNPIGDKKVQLSLAPVYATGIKKTDPLYLQTAYGLNSDYLVYSAVGDTIQSRLGIHNNRVQAMNGHVSFEVPKNWEVSDQTRFTVGKPGSREEVPFNIKVPLDAPIGEHKAYAVIHESGTLIKRIPLRILVQNPVNMEVSAIMYRPGKTEVVVKVRNTSQNVVNGSLDVSLPKGWSVETPSVAIDGLAAEETKEIKLALDWKAEWKADEQAMVTVKTQTGFQLTKAIVPNHYTIHKAKNLSLDGDLSDWAPESKWSTWMMGVDMGEAQTDMHVAWSEEGIYVGFAVDDSKIIGSEPHNFWNGDVIEVLIDSGDNKEHRFFKDGDHQFWLVPQIEKNHPYLGQWKQKNEIPKTRYDIKSVKGSAKKHKNGYVIEALIPASEIKNFNPKVGSSIGFATLITIKGHDHNRNVYWPIKKQWIVTNLPKTWGSLKLAE